MSGRREAAREFECFGSRCSVFVTGDGPAGSAEHAAQLAQDTLLEWHRRFSRFSPESELTLLNGDPRERVPVSPLMARSRGRRECRRDDRRADRRDTDRSDTEPGYTGDPRPRSALALALALAPARRPPPARAAAGWEQIDVDIDADREPSTGREARQRRDCKGALRRCSSRTWSPDTRALPSIAPATFRSAVRTAVNRAGQRQSPFDWSGSCTRSTSRRTGVATSGIGRRSWLDAYGRPGAPSARPGHRPPAFTGVVQVTALAPSALVAEIRAKAALLSGPDAPTRGCRTAA